MNTYATPEEALASIKPADILNAYVVETCRGLWAVCLTVDAAVDALFKGRNASEGEIEAVESCIYEAPDGEEVPVISWNTARSYVSEG